jgi:hypothetical protein
MAASLRTALNGRCDQRPELAQQAIPLEAMVTPLPVRGEPSLVQPLFGPLGYEFMTTLCPPVYRALSTAGYVQRESLTWRYQIRLRLATALLASVGYVIVT